MEDLISSIRKQMNQYSKVHSKEINILLDKSESLQSENKKLREGLEVYAAQTIGNASSDHTVNCLMNGDLARQILKELNG